MKELKNEKEIVLDGKKFIIKFPTIKQETQIESRKAIFSDYNYIEILRNQTNKSFAIIQRINALATLDVLCPDMAVMLDVDSLFDTDRIVSKKLVDLYLDEVFPFLDQLDDDINEIVNPDSEEGDSTEEKK